MLPLLKINLLPYREALQAKQKKEFQTLLIGAVIIGLGLATLGFLTFEGRLSSQQKRNQVLTDGIRALDKDIKKISELEDERKNFMARQEKVEELSNKRFEAAKILDTLNTVAPMGLYITSIEAQNANTYIINGRAFSDAKTAAFMSALPGKLFGTPELLNIKRVNNVQEFSIRIGLNSLSNQNDLNELAQNNDSNSITAEENQATETQNNQSESEASAASN